MRKFFRVIVVLGVLAALAQSAIALTSTQRNVHFTEMLSNIGAVAIPCGFTPDIGYGMICADYPRSGVAFTQAWDLYTSLKTKVSVTAQRTFPWEIKDAALLSTFVTADDDEYVVLVAENNNLTVALVVWRLLPSDGNPTRLGSLGKISNTPVSAQSTGTKPSAPPTPTPPPISPTPPVSPAPPIPQVMTPPLSPPPRPPVTVSSAILVANPDLVTLEKYVQDNSLLYQGFVAGTTTQGAFSSSQNVFFLMALGEKFTGSSISLKSADELQAVLSLGTQTLTIKKK